ncbi:MAG TPA: hypothetical protein IAB57_00750 [Candidatus Fimivivens faecavium]|nr:hypothetical protein [Candidatus Fimivivens faecavium]
MKRYAKILAVLGALIMSLSLAACTGGTSSSGSEVPSSMPESSEPAESSDGASDLSESEAPSSAPEGSEPAESSDGASDASEPAEPSDDASEPSSEAEAGALLYTNEELGFSVELPALLADHYEAGVSEREAYDDVITTVFISYLDGESAVNVLSFEEMSKDVWEKVQAEGGPLGVVLGESDAGRVVVMNPLQSNPFAEGTPEYELFNELPDQLSAVTESFRFL